LHSIDTSISAAIREFPFSTSYNGRAIGSVASSCRLSTKCIVAKRCVLEQKLLLTAYRKSYMRNRLVYQNKWPWPSFRGRINVISTTTFDAEYLGNR